MMLKVFSVHDLKAGAFMSPFFTPSRGIAIRAFCEAAADRNNNIGKYPAEHALFYLGDFDDSTGVFSNASPAPENLGLAAGMIADLSPSLKESNNG